MFDEIGQCHSRSIKNSQTDQCLVVNPRVVIVDSTPPATVDHENKRKDRSVDVDQNTKRSSPWTNDEFRENDDTGISQPF